MKRIHRALGVGANLDKHMFTMVMRATDPAVRANAERTLERAARRNIHRIIADALKRKFE